METINLSMYANCSTNTKINSKKHNRKLQKIIVTEEEMDKGEDKEAARNPLTNTANGKNRVKIT